MINKANSSFFSDRKLKVNSAFTHHVSGANLTLITISCIWHSRASRNNPAFNRFDIFSLVYSLKWLSSEVHLPIVLISRREYRSMTVCSMNLADYKNKYTKMNYWRNVADKFDMSLEDAEKKSRTFAFFFCSQRSHRSYGNRLIVEIVGIARITELIFRDSGDPSDPSDYMETGL